jgi:hypothetical protein
LLIENGKNDVTNLFSSVIRDNDFVVQ